MWGCVWYLFVLKNMKIEHAENTQVGEKKLLQSEAHLYFPGNIRLKAHFALNQAFCTKHQRTNK